VTFPVPGYTRARAGSARVVALHGCAPAIQAIVERQTLYAYAAAQTQSGTRELRGRGPAYAVSLSDECGRVIVRHSRRGGLLGRFVDDLYLSRLRPFRELLASYRLRALGVPTPEMVAYVIYPAGLFIRSDVATREVADGADFAEWLARTGLPDERLALVQAVARLLDRLSEAGAHHGDLNARNILLVRDQHGFGGIVLDVDRVRFHVPRSPMLAAANLSRLERSLKKLQALGLAVSDAEIATLRAAAASLHDRRAITAEEERI
jgi:tRNA A-37 threonylcarbamoyl transferase component Bud32